MKTGPKMPADLDAEARKKWRELVDSVDPSVDNELLGNYCRMYSSLMAIRHQKAQQIKAGNYQTLVPGRDGSLQLNPMQTGENRMVASLNRMLRTLGLAPTREEQDRRKKKGASSTPPPPGFSGPEPAYGWEVEVMLCQGRLNPTPKEIEEERLRDMWLAARRSRGGMHGTTSEL
jgi:phage terminase small subunit